jgi:NAD(P)-dependent dehydrogenase (short-subunit alcohol dehydrogenase family)
MLRQGYGRVVNMTSVIGQIGNFGQANYAASKAGVAAFTKSLAKELAGKGVTVNAVAPGFIETEMVDSICEKVRPRARPVRAQAGSGRPRRWPRR